jgi:hypothetical protein
MYSLRSFLPWGSVGFLGGGGGGIVEGVCEVLVGVMSRLSCWLKMTMEGLRCQDMFLPSMRLP